MTAVASRNDQLWDTMPGWGIVANLLPPEIVAARRLRVVRKLIVAALAAVLLLAGMGFGYAFWQAHRASSGLAAEQARTFALQRDQQRYGEVVRLTGDLAQIQGQLQNLLQDDVDVPTLMASILTVRPAGTVVTQFDVTLDSGSTQNQQATTDSGSLLDASGQAHIGSITVTGQTSSLPAVAAYATRLSQLHGIVSVFPTSLQNSGKAVQFTVEMTVTDLLYSHRYGAPSNAPPSGSAPTTGGNR